MHVSIAQCEGSGILEYGKFLLVESGILESLLAESGILCFGTLNSAQRNLNPTKDWNPEIKFL